MSIVFFAPTPITAGEFRQVLSTVPDKTEVVEALLGEAVQAARRLEGQGAEVFVARGGTAMLLKKERIKTPVVEIRLSSTDLVQALARAKAEAGSEDPAITVIAFPNMIPDLNDFLPFLNLNIVCRNLPSEKDAVRLVEKAIGDGAQVILGGAITTRISRERGVPAVLLGSGEGSILLALEEAKRIVYARRLEVRRGNELKAMLDHTSEGIIAVDREGKVTTFNPVAQAATGIPQKEALGRPYEQIIPGIRFKDSLESGSRDLGGLVDLGHSRVLVNRIPIQVDGEVVGVVATFQEITKIQSMEERIRREIYSQGHAAKFSFVDIYGSSPPLLKAIEAARQYSWVDATVLIHGETGVGKELFAQSIHTAGGRRGGPFVAVNCAALPEALLESELFGYVEGAFTGARRKGKPGLFELAHRGTIFLDEVSEIPLSLQGRLLRVLQEREVIRLGHDRVIPVDVRVLCATNRDLNRHVEEGHFRRDLFWRLNVLSLHIPPLRERRDDIMPLMWHFLDMLFPSDRRRFVFSEDAPPFLTRHPWPGNVRELRNLCERLSVVRTGRSVDAAFLEHLLEYREPSPVRPARSGPAGSEEIERALAQAGGKIGRAAEILGVHRATLWRKCRRLAPERNR